MGMTSLGCALTAQNGQRKELQDVNSFDTGEVGGPHAGLPRMRTLPLPKRLNSINREKVEEEKNVHLVTKIVPINEKCNIVSPTSKYNIISPI